MHHAIDLQTAEGTTMLIRMSDRQSQLAPPAAHAAPSHVERAASWLSIACAVHCLVMPLVLGALPLLGTSAIALDESLEKALTALVIVSAFAGGAWGYRRHRDLRFVAATMLGLGVYLVGHALEPRWYGVLAAVLGALLLAATAFLSARLGHAHAHHHADASCTH
jgi:hypothetical protein